jgi:hypothetical protein
MLHPQAPHRERSFNNIHANENFGEKPSLDREDKPKTITILKAI